MGSELLSTMAALSAALLVVLAARGPLRRRFGARVGYALWLLPPAAVLASLMPAPVRTIEWSTVAVGSLADPAPAVADVVASTVLPPPGIALWLLGAAVLLLAHCVRQQRFVGALQATAAAPDGLARSAAITAPLAIGLWRPRVVVPVDFERRYDPTQQALMLAHERAHIAAGDLPAQALALLVACLAWWNPLAWWSLRAFRHDQELACDARLLEAHRDQRRAYAESLLLAQLHGERLAAPLACHWPTGHPLKERIAMLTRPQPSARRRRAGFFAIASAAVALGGTVWASQPAQVVGAEPDTYAVRVLLSRPGQPPLLPTVMVREGETAGIRSDGTEISLRVSEGSDGVLLLASELRQDGKLVGTPSVGMKRGEPATIAIDGQDGYALTFWVQRASTPPAAAATGSAPADVRTPPRYPADAMKAGIEGVVEVSFEVDATGVVRDPQIVSAEPPGVFDHAALAAVRGWWLNPTQFEQPLPARMQVPIRFELDDSASAPQG